MSDHDPFTEPETAHPRARELMKEEVLWDCAEEDAPFGSDEGFDAYYEFRAWRAKNKKENLTACFEWIMQSDDLKNYNQKLGSDAAIKRDLANPDEAFLADDYDMFTLDATVIATALGQLIDEGRIDKEAKPYVRVAIKRQMHPKVVTGARRKKILKAIERIVETA
jgi:uncharacterized protein YfeS